MTQHAQHPASSQQLKQISQRNNFRGYDSVQSRAQHRLSQPHTAHKQAARPAEHHAQPLRANALSGNDSRSANWRAQQQRGLESRQRASLNGEQRAGLREHLSERHSEHRELRHR